MIRPRWIASLVLVASACSPSAAPSWGQPADAAAAHEEPRPPTPAPEQGRGPTQARPALALLATIAVREHGPKLGYARDQFGPAWADTDRNGCDTRNDILRRDLREASPKPNTRDCVVQSGALADPYTGRSIRFARGGASEVDIDHVVALGNAWVSGAGELPFKQRLALANDPLNLLAVEAAANRAKGDHDAATWLPPSEHYHCAYVARQIAVKAKYGLRVTAPEREAMARVLRACPDEPAPVGDAPIVAPINPPEPGRTGPAAQPRPAEARVEAETRASPQARTTDPDYGSCQQAKAHGGGPYVRGKDPEYAYYQDRDGDGVVCE